MVVTKTMAVAGFFVGVAAGAAGTSFGVSHGVVCMPVLTMPPFNMVHHVAVGTTSVGVAIRQVMALGLFSNEQDDFHIDMNSAFYLTLSSLVTSLWCARRLSAFPTSWIQRLGGLLLVSAGIMVPFKTKLLPTLEEDFQRRDRQDAYYTRHSDFDPAVTKWPRIAKLCALGMLSGSVLGVLGIGSTWLLSALLPNFLDMPVESANHTAFAALFIPSIVTAFTHWRYDHCGPIGMLCTTIGVGAIGGGYASTNYGLVVYEEDFEPRAAFGAVIALQGLWWMVKKC